MTDGGIMIKTSKKIRKIFISWDHIIGAAGLDKNINDIPLEQSRKSILKWLNYSGSKNDC